MFTIEQAIQMQMDAEGPKSKPVRSITHPINPLSHTPVYKMHRYYARRPHNLFSHLITHYTEAGDTILDPFCGGGVTVVEGLKLRRKVVGVDLNPLATFITRMEVTPVDPDEFQTAFLEVVNAAEAELSPLYLSVDPTTKKKCKALWWEWGNTYKCPGCNKKLTIGDERQMTKLRGGTYQCGYCGSLLKPLACEKLEETLLHVCIENSEGVTEVITPSLFDKKLAKKYNEEFEQIVASEKLWFPKEKFPDGDRQRDDAVFQKGIVRYSDFFTKRNVIALSRLLKCIKKLRCKKEIKEFLYFCFSGTLRYSNRMCFRSEAWRGMKFVEWPGHNFWIPEVTVEGNVLDAFQNRLRAVKNGLKQIEEDNKEFTSFSSDYDSLYKQHSVYVLTLSSHDLPLPNHSIDAIITDPPFGGNVQYAELSNFYVVWLRDIMPVKGIIDNAFEAIQTRHSGFDTEKPLEHYEEMLYKVFKECHRVLKPGGWMVMTFHNRELAVWMALHRAANRAGFKLPPETESRDRGMIYQPPIELYKTTFHQRAAGSMLGDFILSFQRQDRVVDLSVQKQLTIEQERQLIDKITQIIEFQGGADDTTIMSGLIPALNELGILHRVSSFDWSSLLATHFYREPKAKKWFLKSQVDPETKALRPIDYIPAEEIVQKYVVGHLREHHFATLDEILQLVYTAMVNSHRPGVESIHAVLQKYCLSKVDKKKGSGFILRPERPGISSIEDTSIEQEDLFGNSTVNGKRSHNELIWKSAQFAMERGYQLHVGETEQRKESQFKEICVSMTFREDWGIADQSAFDKIKEIDLLILDGKEIPVAIEVATTIDTADKAINSRFRDLFVMLPNTKIRCFVIVRDSDFRKGQDILNSPANLQIGLLDHVRIIRESQLTKDFFISEILRK